MREKKLFGKRTVVQEEREPKTKIFFACEGQKTELIYLEGIKRFRKELGLDPLFEIVPLVHSFGDENISNPKRIVSEVMQTLELQREGAYTIRALMSAIVDYLKEEFFETINSQRDYQIYATMEYEVLKRGWQLSDKTSQPYRMCEHLLEFLQDTTRIENIQIAEEIIRKSAITYDSRIDKICFVFDRDKESFTEEQYDHVHQVCNKNGYHLCITNPCFEFWLLLHFANSKMIDTDKMLENEKVSSRKRYAEYQLHKYDPQYRKHRYDVNKYLMRLEDAIENERDFAEDIPALKYQVGSNIGRMLLHLKQTRV